MEEETVTRHNYDQFLEGYGVSGSSELDLLEREDHEVPEQVIKDNARLWLAGTVAILGGAGLMAISNLGLFAEAWPYALGVGIAGVGIGAMRLMRRVFRKKTLDLPPLELRRKTEKTTQNAMSAFSRVLRTGRLAKSESDKVIMGVCGGLAAQTGISATLIRAIFIAAFAITSGLAAIFYIGLGLILPSDHGKQG